MTDQPATFTDLVLNPSGDAVAQHNTPHGPLRTLLTPSTANDLLAQLRIRYDATQLVFALGQGAEAVALTEQTIEWLWHGFPPKETDANQFAESLYTYLQHEARSISKSEANHSIVVGALTRDVPEGRLWLSWLGTSSLRVLNIRRIPLPLDEGLFPGEGWSPLHGVSPDRVQPHVQVFPTNLTDRLLVFSSPLRTVIDELPFIGRTALQRIADAHAQTQPVLLMDLRLYRVNPDPGDVALQYRWDNPYEATLFWTNSPRATGYRIEQASSPSFEDVVVVADMTDARQRVHSIQPTTTAETYYRVVPYSQNMPGKPSAPVMVTPIQLVPPVLYPVEWGEHGFRVEWSEIAQANMYEVEASPDPDFDSSQTVGVYRGSDTHFETEDSHPAGWFFRVRSANTLFAPRSPSQWSKAAQSAKHLAIPLFESVTPQRIAWTTIPGAKLYEVRQQSPEGNKNAKIHVVETHRHFDPPKQRPSLYQVRALHMTGDEITASQWSEIVAINTWLDGEKATARVPVAGRPLEDDDTAELPGVVGLEDTDTLELRRKTSKTWRNWAIGTAIVGTGAVMLLLGLIGGPRLGIGLDPTATSLNLADRAATATQLMINQENAIALATQNSQMSRIEARGTEFAFQVDQLATSNSILREQSYADAAELASIHQTSTAQANLQATAAADFGATLTANAATATYGIEAAATFNAQSLTQAAIEHQRTIEALTPTPPVQRFGKWLPAEVFENWLQRIWN